MYYGSDYSAYNVNNFCQFSVNKDTVRAIQGGHWVNAPWKKTNNLNLTFMRHAQTLHTYIDP